MNWVFSGGKKPRCVRCDRLKHAGRHAAPRSLGTFPRAGLAAVLDSVFLCCCVQDR